MTDAVPLELIWKVFIHSFLWFFRHCYLQPEGDVSLSAEDKPPSPSSYTINTFPSELKSSTSLITPTSTSAEDDEYDYIDDDQEPEEPPHHFLDGHTALKFLFAGGVAGAGMTFSIILPTL